MAQNVTIAGATFNDVPSIETPVSGGGVARFVDTSDADATASDIALGKTAYVNGALLVGTAEQGVVPYKAGDSVTFATLSYTQFAGGMRGSGSWNFTVPLSKPVASGVTASVSGSVIEFHGGAYRQMTNIHADNNITLTVKVDGSGVTVHGVFATPPSWYDSNTPCIFQAYGLTIAFS